MLDCCWMRVQRYRTSAKNAELLLNPGTEIHLQDPQLVWVNSVPKMNRTNLADQKFVYNFYSIHIFGWTCSDNSKLLWKKSKVSMRSKVRGFYPISLRPNFKFSDFKEHIYTLYERREPRPEGMKAKQEVVSLLSSSTSLYRGSVREATRGTSR
jgi:hypothetical protein